MSVSWTFFLCIPLGTLVLVYRNPEWWRLVVVMLVTVANLLMELTGSDWWTWWRSCSRCIDELENWSELNKTILITWLCWSHVMHHNLLRKLCSVVHLITSPIYRTWSLNSRKCGVPCRCHSRQTPNSVFRVLSIPKVAAIRNQLPYVSAKSGKIWPFEKSKKI